MEIVKGTEGGGRCRGMAESEVVKIDGGSLVQLCDFFLIEGLCQFSFVVLDVF